MSDLHPVGLSDLGIPLHLGGNCILPARGTTNMCRGSMYRGTDMGGQLPFALISSLQWDLSTSGHLKAGRVTITMITSGHYTQQWREVCPFHCVRRSNGKGNGGLRLGLLLLYMWCLVTARPESIMVVGM